MANWTALKAAIAAVIKTNGNKEITGAVLQSTLNTIVSNLGENATFKGVATPTIVPGTPDGNLFYIAVEKGVYTNFNALEIITTDGLVVFTYNGSWTKTNVGLATKIDITKANQDLITNVINLTPIVLGKNKLIERYTQDNSYISDLGVIGTNASYRIVKYIPIVPSTQYCLTDKNNNSAGTSTVRFQFLDVNRDHISTITGDNKTFITPSNAYYMNVTINKTKTEIQLELGTVRTTYEVADILATKFNKSDFENSFGKGSTKAIGQKIISETIGNTYYKHNGTATATYTSIGFPSVIKAGTIIKNTGSIVIIFAQDLAFTGRVDLNPGSVFTAAADLNVVMSQNVTGNYEIITFIPIQKEMIPVNSIGTSKLEDSSITTDKIQNDSVTIDKITFFESINLINKNDPEYQVGKYLNSNGVLSTNALYDTTAFIKVVPLANYYYSAIGGEKARFLLYYDINKVAIQSSYQSVPEKLQTVPENAYFIRLSVYATYQSQFEKGTEPTAYSVYKKILPQSLIQPSTDDVSVPYFFLPKDIYVAVGRTIEIYYEQVVLNAFKWNIQAVCTVGQPLKRKFRVIGDLAHIGTYTLTLRAFNDKGEQAGQKTCTIHIVNDSIATTKKLLPVGDSITNEKPWLPELTTLNANLTRVGTRGTGHEGRSGASCSFYLNTDGTSKYTFEKAYNGIGSNAAIFNQTQNYAIGEFVKYKTEIETSYSVFQFKAPHTANTPWSDTEVNNISDTNPFWNFNNNTFSYNHYKTFQSITPDCILLWLGTNGINSTPETNINGALGIKQIIDNIRTEDLNIPIVVINTIFRGNQNGIGIQSNADGFSTPTSYKFDEDVKVLLLEQALENMIGDIAQYPNVYLCPVAATHDSEYNFMNLATAKQGVNPRITGTDVVFELFPAEATHPQTAGYLQAADEIYSTLCAVFS